MKVGIAGLAFVSTAVVFSGIYWLCQKRRKNEQQNQVKEELSEKDKKGNSDYRWPCDYTSHSNQRWSAKASVYV